MGQASVVILDDGQQKTDAPPLLPGTASSGLRGLAERVAISHGSFEAGEQEIGGFRLFVMLPLKVVTATPVEPVRSNDKGVTEGAGR